MSLPTPAERVRPSFGEAFRFWLKLGFISFGGPTGQIAIMHTELVERKRWIDGGRFLHALNYCMLLPGPEAQQLATYSGWVLHGTWGGIVAGALFVLPSAVILWGLSWLYLELGTIPWIGAAFFGLQIAVMAIVAQALIRIAQKVLKNPAMWALAGVAFICLALLHVPFPLIVLGAGLIGWLGGRLRPELFVVLKSHGGEAGEGAGFHFGTPPPSWGRFWRVLGTGLGVWFLPLIALGSWLGWQHRLVAMGMFFSKAAVVTFGGAYAVLPYVAQRAVEDYGWVTTEQMMTGLGLAESTPGPLIMVLQFVDFAGGWSGPDPFGPLVAATLGSAITTWVTFVPSMLWIFLGGPSVERLRGNERISAAMSAITAAVVGVILNLAVWFGWHVVHPKSDQWDGFAIVLGLAAFFALQWQKWNVIAVIAACAALGAGWRMLG